MCPCELLLFGNANHQSCDHVTVGSVGLLGSSRNSAVKTRRPKASTWVECWPNKISLIMSVVRQELCLGCGSPLSAAQLSEFTPSETKSRVLPLPSISVPYIKPVLPIHGAPKAIT